MKLLRFLRYDFEEGIIKYWYKYLIVILLVIAACISSDVKCEAVEKLFGEKTSFFEYGFDFFLGKLPYHFSQSNIVIFEPPYIWVSFYIALLLCMGNFIEESINNYGGMLILKSKSRAYWWISKCIWVLLINVVNWMLFWISNISYAWIRNGEISINDDAFITSTKYGAIISQASNTYRMLLTICMPLLVGIACSLLNMVLVLVMGSFGSMMIMIALVIFSTYYATGINPYEYALIIRYFEQDKSLDFTPLQPLYGVFYLISLGVFMMLLGYVIIRKKNLITRRYEYF